MNHHTVTVTRTVHDAGTEDEIVEVNTSFVCTAPPTSKCRTYPSCDCESWGLCCDHPYESGQECWAIPWFDDPGWCSYVGADADDEGQPTQEQQGRVLIRYADPGIEWEWADE